MNESEMVSITNKYDAQLGVRGAALKGTRTEVPQNLILIFIEYYILIEMSVYCLYVGTGKYWTDGFVI